MIDPRIAALLAGNLMTTMGMLMLTGMANELSDDLHLPVAALGPLLAVAPLVLALGAPILAMSTSHFGRRSLLVGAMLIGAASHLLAAISGSITLLVIARGLTGLGTALFSPQAAATAMQLVPASQRGRVVSLLFIGFAAAHTVGLPLSTWLAAAIGWRSTVAVVGLLSLAIALWLRSVIPAGLPAAPLERSAWGELIRHPAMVATIIVTALQVGAQFVLYSFIAPSARESLGASPTLIGMLFAALGVGGILGNTLTSRIADRIGPVRTTAYAIISMLIAMLLWPFARHSAAIAIVAMAIWGVGSFPAASGQQVRLVGLNMKLATVSLAVNTSGTYAGSAMGTMIGSGLLASFGYESLSWGASAVFALALALHWASTRHAFNPRNA